MLNTNNNLSYEELLSEASSNLSEKELALLEWPNKLQTVQDIPEIREILINNNFVKCEGGIVKMGIENGLPCSIEGERKNETPIREFYMPPFYVSKYTVTNQEYEMFDKKHSRTNTSSGDRNPVTCITYGKAVGYALWLNKETGLSFSLPTEPQYILSASPYGWHYPFQEKGIPHRKKQNHYRAFTELYPEGELGSTLEVDDPIVPPNYLGIHHPTGNVSIFTLGHYAVGGHWGSISDGSYVIVTGGNFRLCPFGTRTVTRGILDVTAITDTVGIRLIHPDPQYLWDAQKSR